MKGGPVLKGDVPPSPSDEPSVVRTQTLFDGWGTLRRYELSDGSSREVYDHGHAVACLAYDPERGTVLLARQFRLPIALHGNDLPGDDPPGNGNRPHDGISIEAPAGLIDEGETPEAAMRREMEEETGFRVRDLRPVADLFASPGSLSERMVLFTARYGPDDRVGAGGGLAEEGENITILEVSLGEARTMLLDGRIRDLKTAFLVLHLATRNDEERSSAQGDASADI